jgi:ABC-type uncharacterized transport system substrate-binding protein
MSAHGRGDAERYRTYAAELIALAPDVVLAAAGSTIPALLRATRAVPIVFAQTPDPVGAGFIEIDGEAVVCGDDRIASFDLRSRQRFRTGPVTPLL